MNAAERIAEEPAYRRGRNLDEEGLFELVTDEVFRDGQAGPEERRLLFALARVLRLDERGASAIARRSRDRFHAGGLGVVRPFDKHQLYARVLRYCLADGRIDPREKSMIEGLFQIFRLSPDDHKRILYSVRQDPSSTQNAMPVRPRSARRVSVVESMEIPTSACRSLVARPAPVAEPGPAVTPDPEGAPRGPAPVRRVQGHTPGLGTVAAMFIVSGLVAAIVLEAWACLLMVLASLAALLLDRGSYTAIDAKGFTLHTPFTHREIAWKEMRALSRGVLLHHTGGIFTGAAVKISLWTRAGEELSFTRIELSKSSGPFRQLYEEMFEHIGSDLLLEDLAEYQKQGALTFGTLSASEEGLRFTAEKVSSGGTLLEWRQLREIWIEGGRLFLMSYGSIAADFSAPVDSLPNSFSLLEILRRHGHTVTC